MVTKPENVYENPAVLSEESARLREFDVPTKSSLEAIGPLTPGSVLLDIGAGENPGLGNYTRDSGASYISFDVRRDALIEQAQLGAFAVQGDARQLPFLSDSIQTAHARFVLGHFDEEARGQIVEETLRTVKSGGSAVFIDYDWNAIDGSEAILRLGDFTLENISSFDAGYGAKSSNEIEQLLGESVEVEEKRTKTPQMFNYAPVLSLRQVTLKGLEIAGADMSLFDQANAIFDALAQEASSNEPPGYYMPDMVAVIVRKP